MPDPCCFCCCSGGMQAEELSAAIAAAERYTSLAAEVEAARGLMERWAKRAEAQVGGGWDDRLGWWEGDPHTAHLLNNLHC